MGRFISLYRFCRALAAIRSWRPPIGLPGMTAYLGVMSTGRNLDVLLDGPGLYLHAEGPWAAMTEAEVHERLDALARLLARQAAERRERECRGAARDVEDTPPSSPMLAQAGAEFELVMSRLRRKRHIIPIAEAADANRKGERDHA
jgi:hypothetical protein